MARLVAPMPTPISATTGAALPSASSAWITAAALRFGVEIVS